MEALAQKLCRRDIYNISYLVNVYFFWGIFSFAI